jgi:hypothetical protein
MYALPFLGLLYFFYLFSFSFYKNVKNSLQLPDAFISCIGVAVSPGNLAVAVV